MMLGVKYIHCERNDKAANSCLRYGLLSRKCQKVAPHQFVLLSGHLYSLFSQVAQPHVNVYACEQFSRKIMDC